MLTSLLACVSLKLWATWWFSSTALEGEGGLGGGRRGGGRGEAGRGGRTGGEGRRESKEGRFILTSPPTS